MDSLSQKDVRRLALCRTGLLKPQYSGFPAAVVGQMNDTGHALVDTLGYLQLDTVSVAGARSHAIVLLSRQAGLGSQVGEELLRAGGPLFEYWGHEASWMPLSLYPAFAFRRRWFRQHGWWRDTIAANPKVVARLRARLRAEGPLRSRDLEGSGGAGWWDFKVAKQVAVGLWLSGELAIRERRNFQRTYDFATRIIPESIRRQSMKLPASLRMLLLRALASHGWATTGTLAATWRLRNLGPQIKRALRDLADAGDIVACALTVEGGKPQPGWIRIADLELVARLRRLRPRSDKGVLLSPFDPVLWDRGRVAQLFDFNQVLEIFKPKKTRIYGYYCMPVLAGETLFARVDLKADRKAGKLMVLSTRYENSRPSPTEKQAVSVALQRFADAVELKIAKAMPRI